MKTLQDIKNTYAQEQGYEDWDDLILKETLTLKSPFRASTITENHMNEICIRAQKAALQKAADSAQVQHHNTRTGKKTHASGMGGNGQVYTVDRTSITNPENLIR